MPADGLPVQSRPQTRRRARRVTEGHRDKRGIIKDEAAECWHTRRPLTRFLATTRKGLPVEGTQDWRPSVYTPVTGSVRRRRPPKGLADHLLLMANGRCVYCTLPFTATTYKKTRLVRISLQWDHFTPYAYVGNNPKRNWQPACQVCNRIKSASCFTSVEEAALVILRERDRQGYESISQAWDRLTAEPYSPWVRP